MPDTTPASTHIYVLLDRSGSMESIASDVVGGFNNFIKEQAQVGHDAVVTLVQFDSQDPQEVISSSVAVDNVIPLTLDTFRPRGSTPLLDATAQLIERATLNQQLRKDNNLPAEAIVFVTVTDGEENSSRSVTLQQLRDLVADREKQGWTFVFLSAAMDAYGNASSIGLHADNIQAFDASGDGADLAFASLSKNMTSRRMKMKSGALAASMPFFEDKLAEEHRANKK